jgi:hypothetical protein
MSLFSNQNGHSDIREAMIQADYNLSAYTASNGKTIQDLEKESEHMQMEWNRQNRIKDIAIECFLSLTTYGGILAAGAGFSAALFTFSAAPLLLCLLGMALFALGLGTSYFFLIDHLRQQDLHLLPVRFFQAIQQKDWIQVLQIIEKLPANRWTYLLDLKLIAHFNLAIKDLGKVIEQSQEAEVFKMRLLYRLDNLSYSSNFETKNWRICDFLNQLKKEPDLVIEVLKHKIFPHKNFGRAKN